MWQKEMLNYIHHQQPREPSELCIQSSVICSLIRWIFVFVLLEYRAKLYSRLENRRKKKELREIREQAQPLQERKVIIFYIFTRDNNFLELQTIYSTFQNTLISLHKSLYLTCLPSALQIITFVEARSYHFPSHELLLMDFTRSVIYQQNYTILSQFTNLCPVNKTQNKIRSLDNFSVWQRIIY